MSMIRREHIRRLLVLALLAVCAVLLVFILFYNRTSSPTEVLDDVVMEADVALQEFRYTETEQGDVKWTLTADSAAHDFTTEATRIENVRLQLFDQPQAGEVVLTSKSGTANLDTQVVHVLGDVVITTENGYRFESDSVTFYGNDSESGVITTEDPVHITSAQLDLSGAGMVLDAGKGTLKLKDRVSAIYYPQPREGEQ
jgi:LPS export ABC transporter protein LptC